MADLNDRELLRVIEGIVADDFCENLDMRHEELTGDLKIAKEKLSLIYRMAHSHDRDARCFPVHGKWREEAELVGSEMAKENA